MKHIAPRYWAYIITGLILIICTCSCGVFKKHVHKETAQEETKTTGESVTTRTITEETNTTVTVSESNVEVSGVVECDDSLVAENDDVKAVVEVDKNGKLILKAKRKEKQIPVNTRKTTVEQVAEKHEAEKSTRVEVKDKQKKTDTSIPVYFWLFLLLLAALILWWIKRTFFPYLGRKTPD